MLLLALGAILIWNYWLPVAIEYFNYAPFPDSPLNPDFYAYITAGKAFALGLNPYSDNSEAYPELSDLRIEGYSRFIYPPALLPIYSLWARLDYERARVLWAALYGAVYLLALVIHLFQNDKRDRLWLLVFGVLLTFTSSPVLFHIRQGQVDLLVIGLILISLVAFRKNLKLVSAILMALATLIKVNPVLFLITFVVFYRDLRYMAQFALALVILIALSLLWVPFPLFVDYVARVAPTIVIGDPHYANQSIIIKLGLSAAAAKQLVSLVGFALFTLFAGWLGKSAHLQPTGTEPMPVADSVFLMNALVILLFSGISWHMAYVWVILPSAQVLTCLIKRAVPWFIGMVGLAAILLNARLYSLPVLDSLNLLGGLLMVGCLAVLVLRPQWVLSTNQVPRLGAARE